MSWDLFGTERREAWESFAESVGGTFDPGHLLKHYAVVAQLGQWLVHMSVYDADGGEGTDMRTRAMVELGAKPRVELHVRQSGFFDGLADWLSTPEVTVGDAPFDAAFHIRCADAKLAAAVLTPAIRAALLGLSAPTVNVEAERSLLFTTQASRLRVEVDGTLRDVEALRALWLLTVDVAESLAAQGVIVPP